MIKNRTKALSAIFVVLAAALLLTMSISVAYATTPIPVSGFIIVQSITGIASNPAGNSDNAIATLSLHGLFTGGISGSYASESRWVSHNTGTPDLWRNAHGVNIISPATVMGETGTLTFLIIGKTGTETGGNWVIVGGTDGLAGLYGQGTFSPTDNSFIVSYEGQVHFDP